MLTVDVAASLLLLVGLSVCFFFSRSFVHLFLCRVCHVNFFFLLLLCMKFSFGVVLFMSSTAKMARLYCGLRQCLFFFFEIIESKFESSGRGTLVSAWMCVNVVVD